MSENKVGKAIYPGDLYRVLGHKFVSASALRKKTNLDKEQTDKVIQVLIEQELLEYWLASECLYCKYVWPLCQRIEDITEEVFCPMCNETTPAEYIQFYRVYHVKWVL